MAKEGSYFKFWDTYEEAINVLPTLEEKGELIQAIFDYKNGRPHEYKYASIESILISLKTSLDKTLSYSSNGQAIKREGSTGLKEGEYTYNDIPALCDAYTGKPDQLVNYLHNFFPSVTTSCIRKRKEFIQWKNSHLGGGSPQVKNEGETPRNDLKTDFKKERFIF